jgi:glucose-1-phosphate thymidylyltransferase
MRPLERRQGLRIACQEEVAYQQGFIINDEFVALAKKLGNSAYGKYLLKVAEEYPTI